MKTIVSNRGRSIPGHDSVRKRHYIKENENGTVEDAVYELRVKRTEMLQMLFDNFSSIDIHDHYRQGSLCLEESWSTKTWAHRIFSTVFGMILTDCYFAYKHYFSIHHFETKDFTTFLSKLAYKLIFNIYLNNTTNLRNTAVDTNQEAQVLETSLSHPLVSFSSLEKYSTEKYMKNIYRSRCDICGNQTSYYCASCSKFDEFGNFMKGKCVAICMKHLGCRRECHSKHITKVLDNL